MSKTAHTRGPWKAVGLSIHSDRKDGSPQTWVANVKQGRADAVEIADARLIAAAPDLLEALEAFASHYPMGINPMLDSAAVKARAAIARAKGEA